MATTTGPATTFAAVTAGKETFRYGSIKYDISDAMHTKLAFEAFVKEITVWKKRASVLYTAVRAYKFLTPNRYNGKESAFKAFLTKCRSYFAFYQA
ncbi:hypothetical protein GGTG_13270 [Gaeumannomyces tritici R3-111a-1]|uniref:Uncharacterized protein n=1 Tax=Gaeumannomyces tritici (strain R3-111a-1) TaxID=644352 RepID=J3PIE2_GAET3|nr:hypothetical protein GGTG_13270 [Gaeumannomyces tritici R3-111a-1]EJT69161.1 hypothetical protein GGTG_13270 [Gaeumannomyces tritici R3-111a-1]